MGLVVALLIGAGWLADDPKVTVLPVGAQAGSDRADRAPGAETPRPATAAATPSAQSAARATATPTLPGAPAAATTAPNPARTTGRPSGATGAAAGAALTLLATLPVKGRAPRTGYDRDRFGPNWADADRNGCDTRNDVLARDLTGETTKPGTRGCVVLTGVLHDPYSGRRIAFTRGESTSRQVQVDHVVALADAWQKGAQQWPVGKRLAFANDPLNLLAVAGPLNAQKGDADAATWLPPRKAYRCPYVARQVAVKARYGVWVTAAERAAMQRVLASCPQQPAPRGTAPTVAPIAVGAQPRQPTTGRPVYYAGCDAVRAAGKAPLKRGSPGYRAALDRDRDGVACEPSRRRTPDEPTATSTDPRFGTCTEAKAAGYGPYRSGAAEYAWYRDADRDGVVCE